MIEYFSSPEGTFAFNEWKPGWFAVHFNKKFLGDYVKGQKSWIKGTHYSARLAKEAAGIINNLL